MRRALAIGTTGLLALLATGCGPAVPSLLKPTPPPVTHRVSSTSTVPAVASTLDDAGAPHAEPLDTPTPVASPPPPPPRVVTPARPMPTPVASVRPKPFIQDAMLEAQLREILGADRSHSIYVKNLKDGSGASIQQDRAYPMASVFKAFVMWEAFRQRSAGTLSFDHEMEVTPYFKSFELGTNRVQAGDVVTVRTALELMMSVSDTPTGVLLQDTVGYRNVNASLRSIGIQDSGLFYPQPGAMATARDMGVFLEAIEAGTGVSPALRNEMVALLLSETTDNGLRAGVPATVPVAHKTGLLEDARHDVGIVYLDGSPYVIAILSDRTSANLTQRISRAVHDYYAGGA